MGHTSTRTKFDAYDNLSSFIGLNLEAHEELQERPPGWTHSRHMVVPTTVFDVAGATDNSSSSVFASQLSTTPLLWVADVLLGGRDVAHLILRHPHFDISPWLATGSHARRFGRVWLQSSGVATSALLVGCNEALRWATRLG